MPEFTTRTRRTQFRAENPAVEGAPLTIEGYFVVFGQPYDDGYGCIEYVDRHAFDHCDMSDVRALLDHDSRIVLGRSNETTSTLEFSIDDTGLFGRIQINPDDSDAMNARARVLRGDVDQASFSFEEDDVEYIDNPDGTVRRVIKGISKLWEITVCTFPAYESTSVSARSAHPDNRKRELLEHKKTQLKRRMRHHGKKCDASEKEALH